MLNTWSREVMGECSVAEPQSIYQLEKTGIWGEAVRQRRAIVINDFHAPNPLKKGYPEGHVDLSRFCTVPVFADGRIVAVGGVANKETDYDEGDVRQLTLMMDSVWKIVERQRAVAGLKQSEERYRVLFERSDDGIIILGAEGPEAGQILDCNEAVVKCHGFSREEILAMNITELEATVSKEEIADRMERLLAGEWLKFEAIHHKKDGTLVPVEVSAGCLEYGGVRRIVTFERDISDRKEAEKDKLQLEKQLRQAQKMEAIGTLAGGIAHDFNNLLAVIVGFSDLARESVGEREPVSEYLRQVVEAGERAKSLVKQIMTFSRRTTLEMVKLDLNEAVAQAAKLLERTLPKMISVETRLAEELPPVKGDPGELEQVLLNLATNAQDAMPEGGRLMLETSELTIDEGYGLAHLKVAPGEYLLLQVSDTGQGMDESIRERIFDPFFTTKEPGKGTGLGLATVYGIVKSHGGHIYCYSEPGQGTTFKVYLPVFKDAGQSQAQAGLAEGPPAGGHESILLVDDEKALLELGEAILVQAGYQVLKAQSGEEALEIYRQRRDYLDLVILDLGMPGMGGHRCLKAVLEINPRAKVVIASGYPAKGQARESLQAGAVKYVAKPFGRAGLLASVRAALDVPNHT